MGEDAAECRTRAIILPDGLKVKAMDYSGKLGDRKSRGQAERFPQAFLRQV